MLYIRYISIYLFLGCSLQHHWITKKEVGSCNNKNSNVAWGRTPVQHSGHGFLAKPSSFLQSAELVGLGKSFRDPADEQVLG